MNDPAWLWGLSGTRNRPLAVMTWLVRVPRIPGDAP